MLCCRGLNFRWERDRSEGVSADTEGPLLVLLFGFLTLVFWYQINIRPAEWWPNLFFFFTNNRHEASLPMIWTAKVIFGDFYGELTTKPRHHVKLYHEVICCEACIPILYSGQSRVIIAYGWSQSWDCAGGRWTPNLLRPPSLTLRHTRSLKCPGRAKQ